MEQKEINKIMNFEYRTFPVENDYLNGQPQAYGNVSSRQEGGFNVYDGAHNFIGYFDEKKIWHSNIGESKLSESWKQEALAVLVARWAFD